MLEHASSNFDALRLVQLLQGREHVKISGNVRVVDITIPFRHCQGGMSQEPLKRKGIAAAVL